MLISIKSNEQKVIIKQLCLATKLAESQVVDFLLEMGIGLLIASERTRSEQGLMAEVIEEIQKQVSGTEALKKMAEIILINWNAGQIQNP